MRTLGILLFFLFGLWKPGAAENKITPADENPGDLNPVFHFIENKGQIKGLDGSPRPDILYALRSPGLTVFVYQNGLFYQFSKSESNPNPPKPTSQENENPFNTHSELKSPPFAAEKKGSTYFQLEMQLLNASPSSQAVPENQTPYFENYFSEDSNPDGIKNARSFQKIRIKEVYPNIDWIIYIQEGKLKYDFIVKPGGKISDIKLKYSGTDFITPQKDGSLTIETPLGRLSEGRPYTYQKNGSEEEEVKTRFIFLDPHTVGFQAEAYHPDKPLVIDPEVVWATYYGGNGTDFGNTVAIDKQGNVYMAGSTQANEGVASGGFQNTIGGNYDAFLVKFNANGERLWATYFGGSGDDEGYEMTLDKSGNVYLVGYTASTSGIASGGFQSSHGGGEDAFFAKFSPQGDLLWSTYYGGSGNERASGIAIDDNNNLYIAGYTGSSNAIASEDGFQNTFGGYLDGFLLKLDANGTPIWSTYYGGSGQDVAASIALDGSGGVYLAGTTRSSEKIATMGFQNSIGGNYDAYLAKFDSNGARIWATYYGGSGIEHDNHVAVDPNGDIYLNGITNSPSDIASGGFQNSFGGANDAFLVKFSPEGQRLWATYYGGSGNEGEGSLFLDGDGNAFLAGSTSSTKDIASCGFQNSHGGGYYDAYLVKFNPAGNRLWATYYGGNGEEVPYDPQADSNGTPYLIGKTSSTIGVALNGFQEVYGGGESDAFLVKIDPSVKESSIPEILTEGENPLCGDAGLKLSVPFQEGVTYEWKRNDELLTFSEHSITVTEAGSYSVSLISACETLECDPVEVFRTDSDAPKITAEGSLSFCGEGNVTLQVPNIPEVSYQWKKDGHPIGDNSFKLVARESGIYSVEISSECGSMEAANTVNITSSEKPSAPIAEDVENCGPGIFTLQVQGGSPGLYRWYKNESDPTPVAEISGSEFETPYLEETTTFYVSRVDGPCESERVPVKAIVLEQPEAYAGEDVHLHVGQEMQLQASGGAFYSWEPMEGLSDPHIPNPVAQPEKTTTYTLRVTDTNGCEATDEITVFVSTEVMVPNAFSPNNDGKNDVWEIFFIDAFPECRVSIFNNWGNKLYESIGYQKPWDGTFHGKELPSGYYSYVINLGGEQKPITGTLLLIR